MLKNLLRSAADGVRFCKDFLGKIARAQHLSHPKVRSDSGFAGRPATDKKTAKRKTFSEYWSSRNRYRHIQASANDKKG